MSLAFYTLKVPNDGIGDGKDVVIVDPSGKEKTFTIMGTAGTSPGQTLLRLFEHHKPRVRRTKAEIEAAKATEKK